MGRSQGRKDNGQTVTPVLDIHSASLSTWHLLESLQPPGPPPSNLGGGLEVSARTHTLLGLERPVSGSKIPIYPCEHRTPIRAPNHDSRASKLTS